VVKVKVYVDLHAMKAYKGNVSIAPLILNLSTRWEVSRQLHPPAVLPPTKKPPVLF
jgi:hypothetical protein